MKTTLLIIASVFTLNVYSQAPTIQWQTNLMGTGWDECHAIIQTADGGYAATGGTNSNDGAFIGSKGDMDGWVAKLDASGTVVWTKNVGGSTQDRLYCIAQSTDGGLIAAGYTKSNDGDVSGNHANQYGPYFEDDCWVVKLDLNGNILWQKTLGGSAAEQIWSIKETSDGGCILAATSLSDDGDVSNHHGIGSNHDYWIIKLDASGTIQWEKSLGGSGDEFVFSLDKTLDGGYIIAGSSMSIDGDITPIGLPLWSMACWITKLDANGTLLWDNSFLIQQGFTPNCIKQTSDGGYIIAGVTSDNSDYSGVLLKTDASGTVQWEKTYGGTSRDEFSCVEETSTGGFMVLGRTTSNDGDVSNYYGGYDDCWIVNTDANGNILWEKSYGGSSDDYAYTICKTNDNGYVISTISSSSDYDVITTSNNDYNAWIFKLAPSSVTGIHESTLSNSFSIYPNPANDIIHISTMETLNNESYNLINTLGQTVATGKLTNRHTTIDIHELAAGYYTLQIGDKKAQSYKVIKN